MYKKQIEFEDFNKPFAGYLARFVNEYDFYHNPLHSDLEIEWRSDILVDDEKFSFVLPLTYEVSVKDDIPDVDVLYYRESLSPIVIPFEVFENWMLETMKKDEHPALVEYQHLKTIR